MCEALMLNAFYRQALIKIAVQLWEPKGVSPLLKQLEAEMQGYSCTVDCGVMRLSSYTSTKECHKNSAQAQFSCTWPIIRIFSSFFPHSSPANKLPHSGFSAWKSLEMMITLKKEPLARME